MPNLIKVNKNKIASPVSAVAHLGSQPLERAFLHSATVALFPERVNRKIEHIYHLMSLDVLTKSEKQDLKLLLTEDRILAYHVAIVLFKPENWGSLADKPGTKVLLKKAPLQAISGLADELEVASLLENPPAGMFYMVKSLLKSGVKDYGLLIAVVGHPLLPEQLQQWFGSQFEGYVSAVTAE